MRIVIPREKPPSWAERKAGVRSRWARPFVALEWLCDWLAYYLSNWKLLEVLEYLSSLSILVAAIFYFAESGDRVKQKHYQAWQVINTAQGKGGSGGRLEALQELNADHVPLVGVDVAGAYLQGIRLEHSSLLRANFSAADVRMGDLRGADFSDANLRGANFRGANFSGAVLRRAELDDADLVDANLAGADLAGASLANTDLWRANFNGARWRDIANIQGANLGGMKDAPEGFRAWALQHGAVETQDGAQ
jgi:hypothetical protein